MSDTCIVCLGDLSIGNGDAAAINLVDAKSPAQTASTNLLETTKTDNEGSTEPDNPKESELIAHIQPCGHYLHNQCLTPWVERANSCPICRASFRLVELKHQLGGPVISTYSVENRVQVADLDPTMFLEVAEEEDEEQPCQACGEDDNEDVLMYCDGCQKLWHTYCVDLQEVPRGAWFCDNCRAQRAVDPRPLNDARPGRRRTRGQQRRTRRFQSPDEQSWNAVWQTVWSSIGVDLDFPYDDDDTSAAYIRRQRQRSIRDSRSAHDAWRARVRVADLQGAGNRFRETEPILSGSSRITRPAGNNRPSPVPQEQNVDEVLAWDAFDQARASSAEPSSRRKKRKSRTSSPAENEERTPIIKRRRTSQSAVPAASSASRERPAIRPISPTPRRPPPADSGVPSFLQSLLQEVEESSNTPSHLGSLNRPSPRTAGSPPADQYSPRPSSPAQSPLPSNHSSPRAMSATPPPPGSHRPSSPAGLSSSIQPIFAPTTDFSPIRAGSPPPRDFVNGESGHSRPQIGRSTSASSTMLAQPKPQKVITQPADQTNSPPTLLNDISPTRATMSLSAKSDVQKLVSAALKPHYSDQTISKDQYTTINRDISRMLYEKIGDFDTLQDDDRVKWEKVAGDEVNKAVDALRATA